MVKVMTNLFFKLVRIFICHFRPVGWGGFCGFGRTPPPPQRPLSSTWPGLSREARCVKTTSLMQQYVSSETCEMVKMPELQGLRPLAPHLDPASGPKTPCLWEFHFLEKEPPPPLSDQPTGLHLDTEMVFKFNFLTLQFAAA